MFGSKGGKISENLCLAPPFQRWKKGGKKVDYIYFFMNVI